MHILAAHRKLARPIDLSLMEKLKRNDSSRTFETSAEESSSSWDVSEKVASQEEQGSDDDLNRMIDEISREVAQELANRVKKNDDSESVSSCSSSDSSRLEAHSIANSLLSMCRDVDGNIWDLELDDVMAGDDDNVSELDYDASEYDTLSVSKIAGAQVHELLQAKAKVKPAAIAPHRFTVQFDTITVREYGIVLGDNPACRSGPSVSIGWEYDEFPEILVDDFESIREGNRRTKRGMLMDRSHRVKVFKRLGYADNDIIEAVRLNKKIHQARLQTLSKGIVGSKLSNVSRKLQGFMPKRSSNPNL